MPVTGTRVATWRNALLVSSEQRLAAPVRQKNELASDQPSFTYLCICLRQAVIITAGTVTL